MIRFINILGLSLLVSLTGFTQSYYMTREGRISFYSSAPLEDIEAVNDRVQARLDSSTGEILVRLRIEDFTFRLALMQKHFNERYMESHIYPEARFSGVILNFDEVSGQENQGDVIVKGSLTIHGVTREVEVSGTRKRSGPHLIYHARFPVRVEDYDIKIPRMLIRNIAEVVEVTVDMRLVPGN